MLNFTHIECVILYSSFGFVQFAELIIDLNPYTKEKCYV